MECSLVLTWRFFSKKGYALKFCLYDPSWWRSFIIWQWTFCLASEKEQSPGSREYSLAKDIYYENKIFQWWITHEKGWHYGWVLSANIFLAFFVFSYKVFVEEMMVLRSKSSLWPIHCSSPSHRRQYQRACAIRSFDINPRREQ